jgi:two-component system phosphate regulon response regulator PhoB
MPRILVIEDEPDIQAVLRFALEKDGHQVTLAGNGGDGLQELRRAAYDLVLLDLMLPDRDGLEVCRIIRSDPGLTATPVIMVTAKGEETDIVTGLELGAHDYICKPFSLRVLVARVRVCLRRTREPADADGAVVRYQNIVVDPARHQVHLGEHAVDLTATEFRLLHFLARRPGWVFTRTQIIEAVRGDNYSVTERAVDVQIVGLRRKLAQYGECIETVRGVGYRMQER